MQPLASALALPLISGGDRHGLPPNAILNLTPARSFDEFVCEVRDGVSHVVVMPEYRAPMVMRKLSSMSDVLRRYRRYPLGQRNWTDRVSWDNGDGAQPLSLHWPRGGPLWVRSGVHAVRFVTARPVLATVDIALRAADCVVQRNRPVFPPPPANHWLTGKNAAVLKDRVS